MSGRCRSPRRTRSIDSAQDADVTQSISAKLRELLFSAVNVINKDYCKGSVLFFLNRKNIKIRSRSSVRMRWITAWFFGSSINAAAW
jgi:hypothetical protein